jgi:hypothetical protein
LRFEVQGARFKDWMPLLRCASNDNDD